MKCSAPILLAVMFLYSCAPSRPSASSNLVTDRGTFPSPSATYELVIGSKSKSLVDYKIVSVATKQEFAPESLFSDAMRWAAFWENDEALWVHSSDIGLSVWKADSSGMFTQTGVGRNPSLVAKIPQELWDFLPSSSKRQWAALRQPNRVQDAAPNP